MFRILVAGELPRGRICGTARLDPHWNRSKRLQVLAKAEVIDIALGMLARKLRQMMLSHVTVGTNDLDRAGKFYDAVLGSLGLIRRPVIPDGGPPALCWVSRTAAFPRFYVYAPFDLQSATVGNGSMIAFLAPSPRAVAEAFEKGMENGGTSEGDPGPRPHYGEGYIGAYLRDPDRNKLHIVHRGDMIDPLNL